MLDGYSNRKYKVLFFKSIDSSSGINRILSTDGSDEKSRYQRSIYSDFSDGITPGTSDSDQSRGGPGKSMDRNLRSSSGTSGYSCGTDTSSSDSWAVGRKRGLFMSETPLPGMTPHARVPQGNIGMKSPN